MKSPKNLLSYICNTTTLCLLFLFFSLSQNSISQQLAFPGAEGFGKYITGGRGGSVIKVTNLNDSGPGSLREAAMTSGTRTIVFEVGGTITLKSILSIKNGNVTVAGQTAPGGGILIKGSTVIVESSNVIIRYLRFRPGITAGELDALSITAWGNNVVEDVIIDHCSLSWAGDENLNIRATTSGTVRNVTIQNTIISESGYGALVHTGTQNITFYKNLFAHNQERNIHSNYPTNGTLTFEMINNLLYGFRWATGVALGSKFAVLNNSYKKSAETAIMGAAVDATAVGQGALSGTDAYISGNIMPNGMSEHNSLVNSYIKTRPYASSGTVAIQASQVANDILPHVGASLPKRDQVDVRIINQYNNGSGSLETSGNYPDIKGGQALADTDEDGMPDIWETSNGLNPNEANDRNSVQPDGYTNLEYYLNGMTLQTISISANAGNDVEICQGTTSTLTVTGGSIYLWSTGATTDNIEVSPDETTTYTVTAYDASGNNSDSDDIVVTVNALPEVNASSDITINSGETTTLTATGATTYEWSTGESGASITVSPKSTKTYTVTGTENGCEATATVKVTVANPIEVIADAGADQSICSGTSTTLTATGGATYLWSTGETTESISVSPGASTVYSVTAYDSTGNGSDTDEVEVTVTPLPTVDAGKNITINSGETTTLSVTGATNYKWSTGESGASITVSPKSTKTYTVTGTENGCEATATVKVTVANPIEVIADAGADQSICSGTSTTLTATGGATYLWSTGETTESISVSPGASTVYSVTAYDSTGNSSDTDEVEVTVTALPTVDAGKNITINSGETTTLSVTGATNYKWSTGESGASITVSPKSTKTYTVTGTDNGCEATATVKVTVANPIEVIADAGKDQSICSGTSTTLTATGGATYLWSTGETTESISVSPGAATVYSVTAYDSTGNSSDTDEVEVTVTALPRVDAGKNITINSGETTTLTATGATTYEWSTGESGASITVSPKSTKTYTVTGTENGCEATATVKVTVANPIEVIADAGADQSICSGTSTTLTATGGATYLWSTGETTESISVSPGASTTYSVTAYDGTGNSSDTDETEVRVTPLPTVDAGKNITINSGETTTLTATGATNYKWSTGESGASITVSPKSTKTYTVTGTENGCEATATVKVTVANPIEVIADAGKDQSICSGTSTTLTATGGATYLWSTGETTESISVSPGAATVYSVTAYDSTGNSSDTDEVEVTVTALPTVDAGKNITINSGETTTLTATGATAYEWSTGEIGTSITVSPKSTKTYTVTGTENGCEATATVKVTVANPIEVIADAGEDQSICSGTSTTLTATGGATYLWSTGETTESISVSPGATTTYAVTAYDSTGNSSDTDEVEVTVTALPRVDAGKNITINSGETTTLTATGATTYEWSTGESGASITVSPKSTKTYTVTGTENGCEATARVKVTVANPIEVIADAGADQSICSGTSTTLTATGGATYLWSTGETTESISVSPGAATTYAVTAYDGTGNSSDTDEVEVTITAPPTVDAGKNITIKSGETTTLTATGATTYEWSTGESGASITVSPEVTQTYKVMGTDNGCEATATVKVTVAKSIEVIANAGKDQNICAGTTTTLTATGGKTYLWNTGETSATISVSPTAKTTYSVTAFRGSASATDDVVVYVGDKPNVVIANGTEATILEGEFITLSAYGANTYKWSNGATQPNIAVSPRVTKNYDVTGFVNECASQKSITVNVFEKVVANAGQDVTICSTENTVLTAQGPDNSEYLWSTGETSKSITVGPKEDTEYSVMVYHQLDSDTDSVMVKVENCQNSQIEEDSEIVEASKELEFLIHPNPTHGDINIKISGLTNLSSIHLYDLSGKALYSETINEGEKQSYIKTLDLSDYASGIYLLQLVDNETVITKKVVLR